MNTKLSGAQAVLVEIKQIGRNYFPFVENIRSRMIKYVDFAPCAYLPDTTAPGVTSSQNMFVTIMNEYGNTELMRQLPLERLDYTRTTGVRQPVCARISIDTCYIDCQNAAMVGKTALLVFWYDLPEYSQRNMTDNVVTDSVTVPLTTGVRHNIWPDSDRMVKKRFRKILLSAPTVTPDYQPGVAAANMQNLFVTLRKGSYNVVENVPVTLFDQLQMLEKSEFQNIIFDFNNSYITIGGAGTIPTLQTDYIGKSVFLNLQYEK